MITPAATEHPPRDLSRVRDLVYNQPWLMHSTWMEAVSDVVEAHVQGGNFEVQEDGEMVGRPFEMIDDIAIIPVQGVLSRRVSFMSRLSGATSTELIGQWFDAALVDDQVGTILLDIDSPGGDAGGTIDVANKIFAARSGDKPIIATINGNALSGGYFIASQADQVFASQGSFIGSIGVVLAVVDTSRAERNRGIDATIIQTGEDKAPGAGQVTERQIATLRQHGNRIFEIFKAAVRRGRGIELTEEMLSGQVFPADQALELGLIDEIADRDQVFAQFRGIDESQ